MTVLDRRLARHDVGGEELARHRDHLLAGDPGLFRERAALSAHPLEGLRSLGVAAVAMTEQLQRVESALVRYPDARQLVARLTAEQVIVQRRSEGLEVGGVAAQRIPASYELRVGIEHAERDRLDQLLGDHLDGCKPEDVRRVGCDGRAFAHDYRAAALACPGAGKDVEVGHAALRASSWSRTARASASGPASSRSARVAGSAP